MSQPKRICFIDWLTQAITILSVALASSASAQDAPMLQPTPQHELLKKDVGVWDAKVKLWTDPSAEPMESNGTETNEMLGGMWVVSRFEGKMAEMPFTGVGTFGYDPVEKKYVGTWVDSMSPYLMTMKGDYDPVTKTMTTMSEGRDPATGKMATSKMITRHSDENTRTFEIHMQGDNGQYQKMMEIQYKRRPQ